MLVHRMVKKVKDSKVWAKINTKDQDEFNPGDHVKGKGGLASTTGISGTILRKTVVNFASGPQVRYIIKLDDGGEREIRADELTKDSDPRGYKVSDQIIKGFLIYKSGKGPATYFAKNENGKEFEGTMEQIKKQIDDYWVKQDEDVMKQKMKDGQSYNMAVEYELFTYYNIPRSQARQIVERNSQELQKKEDANITIHNAAEMLIHKEGIKGFEKIYVTQGDSKTRDEVFTNPRYVLYHTKWKGLDISQLKDKTIVWENNRQLKSINGGDYDALAKAQDWIDAFRRKTKDKAPKHPRWRIKDDKLFRLRSAIKKVKRVKDVELSNRAVWRKEDFDKMVAAGNFTIVSKQPWGYEVKVKSGNIYGVEIKDTYTKGSADRKTKDVNLMFEFLIKIVKEGTGVSTSVAEKAVSKLLDAEGPISAGVDNSVIIRKAKKYLPSKDSFTYTKGRVGSNVWNHL